MISFTPFYKENLREVAEAICPQALLSDALEIMESALHSDREIEYAAAICSDCLCLRAFEYGKYYFIYPFMLTEGADAHAAVLLILEYAIREELALTVADVPTEELADFISGFRNVDLDAEDVECSSYKVTVKTPPMLLSEIPSYCEGELSLGALTESDISEYARLSRATETTRYWGYDYRADTPEALDEYFYDTARLEFERGIAMTFAVRWCGRLVGEAVAYAFDGRGSAEIAIRIFPELWGRGIGKRTVRAMKDIFAGMGISRLYARVHNENDRSLRLFSSFSERGSVKSDHTVFEIKTLSDDGE